MRKKAAVAAILAASFLVTSCSFLDSGSKSRSRRDRDRDDDNGGSGFSRRAEETTETTEETAAPTPVETTVETTPPAPTAINPDDYMVQAATGYLEVLAEREEDILAYDWMNYWYGDDTLADGFVAPEECYNCGLADLNGDDIAELLIMTSMQPYVAVLEVYSYDPARDEVICLGSIDNLDVQVAGGGRYLIAVLDDGFLLVYTSMGDENWTDIYDVYAVFGDSLELSGSLEMDSYYDQGNTTYEYYLNGAAVDEEEFLLDKTDVLSYVEQILMYNYITDEEMCETVVSNSRSSTTYEDMILYLESFI